MFGSGNHTMDGALANRKRKREIEERHRQGAREDRHATIQDKTKRI